MAYGHVLVLCRHTPGGRENTSNRKTSSNPSEFRICLISASSFSSIMIIKRKLCVFLYILTWISPRIFSTWLTIIFLLTTHFFSILAQTDIRANQSSGAAGEERADFIGPVKGRSRCLWCCEEVCLYRREHRRGERGDPAGYAGRVSWGPGGGWVPW